VLTSASMDPTPNLVTFERPMPVEHRVVYGLFGCAALVIATWLAQGIWAHLGEKPQTDETGWTFLAVLLLTGVPLIAAAVLGGAAEVVLDRPARELREVAWVGPVPAWRQVHPFAVVGAPLVVPGGGKTPDFKIEIPVKDRATVPLGQFSNREEAEAVAASIQAAVAPENLPPFQRPASDLMRARLGNLLLQTFRGLR